VAGGLALLLSALPQLPADRQQAALESGAADLGPAGLDTAYGRGRLDVIAAYDWARTAPDFQVAASPASATVAAGGTASWTVTVTPVNGFARDVSLALGGLAAGQASWAFTPAVVPGGGGTAQLSVTTAAGIAPGTYPLSVTGTDGSLSRTAGVTLVVPAAPDFALTAAPAAATAVAGSAAAYTVGVTARNGFTGVVTLTMCGLPAAVGSATFTPASVTTTGTSQLAVTTSPTAPPGTYALSVVGNGAGTTHAVPVSLTVTPAPDFGVGAAPATATVSRGQTATYTVTVSSTGGFAGAVTLSRSGVPAGVTVTWSANPVAAPGTSTLRLRTSSSTPRGTYTVKVTGTSGSTSRQARVTLTVR
jgi:hypothetical protein